MGGGAVVCVWGDAGSLRPLLDVLTVSVLSLVFLLSRY